MPSDQPALERLALRGAEIGGGLGVRRALPTRGRRTIGAWCFLDHLGPAEFAAGQGPNVGPHPHIGLQTFTWMIEGELRHRDSLGCEQLIRPGQVNLMTAGRGIAHSEETPDPGLAGRVHAAQLWIALPEAQRAMAPAFAHYPELPMMAEGGFAMSLLAGELMGERSPVAVHSPLLGLDLLGRRGARLDLPLAPGFEHGLLVLDGEVEVDGVRADSDSLFYLGQGREVLGLRCREQARVLLLGGEPLGEAPLLFWNFVARDPDEIVAACEDWNAGRRFGEVHGSPLARIPAPDPSGLSLRAG